MQTLIKKKIKQSILKKDIYYVKYYNKIFINILF